MWWIAQLHRWENAIRFWSMQRNRISRDEVLRETLRGIHYEYPGAGCGMQETPCLPIEIIPGCFSWYQKRSHGNALFSGYGFSQMLLMRMRCFHATGRRIQSSRVDA